MNQDIIIFAALALASGRVAHALVHDEIFRPLREWIWMYSAPEEGMVRDYESDGFTYSQKLAAMYHPTDIFGKKAFLFEPGEAPRKAGFVGQIFECTFCMSFWTSALAFVAWLALGDDVIYAAAPLSLWAVANSFAVKGL